VHALRDKAEKEYRAFDERARKKLEALQKDKRLQKGDPQKSYPYDFFLKTKYLPELQAASLKEQNKSRSGKSAKSNDSESVGSEHENDGGHCGDQSENQVCVH
jgi:hypothetical protein